MAQHDSQILNAVFIHDEGHAWKVALPKPFETYTPNSGSRPSQSSLILTESGKPLKKPHSGFPEIRSQGMGHYTHIGGRIYFSTSDNSDPNTNGRCYAISVGSPTPNYVAFGSCHVGFIQRAAAKRGGLNIITTNALTHYTDEVLQLIRYMRSEIEVPFLLKPYMALGTCPPGEEPLFDIDGMLLEICNDVVVRYRGYFLSRVAMVEHIVKPACAIDQNTEWIVLKWFNQGINYCIEEIRKEAADQLLKILPGDGPENAQRLDIIANVRGEEQSRDETLAGVKAILEAIRTPTCLALHTPRYTSDGRPDYWPAGFHERLGSIAQELNLPVLDFAAYVERLGVAFSLAEDRAHYTLPFMDMVSKDAYDLIHSDAGRIHGARNK